MFCIYMLPPFTQEEYLLLSNKLLQGNLHIIEESCTSLGKQSGGLGCCSYGS